MSAEKNYIGTVVTGSVIPIRSGPSVSYPIVSSDALSNGDTFYVYSLERHENVTWGKIDTGWIIISQGSKSFVALEEAPTPSLFAIQNNTNVKDDEVRYLGTAYKEQVPTVIKTNDTNYNNASKASNRVFGMPYQFNPLADIRYDSISNEVGRKFAEHYFFESPFLYVIPGKVKYLPGTSKGTKQATSHALINAASGDMAALKAKLSGNKDKNLRYYDFEEDYTEYMHYVNTMCRTLAAYLELDQTIPVGGTNVPLQKYSWQNYRWTNDKYSHGVTNSIRGISSKVYKSTLGRIVTKEPAQTMNTVRTNDTNISLEEYNGSKVDLNKVGQSQNYVQFFCNPLSSNESYSNQTSDSSIKTAIDSATGSMKEMQFIANSFTNGAFEGMTEWTGESLAQLSDYLIGGHENGISNALNKIIQGGSAVLRGDSIMIPKYYSDSGSNKQTDITIELKTPYGDKFSVYMDVLVPLCHLIALALPKQSSSNTYGSPFIVKAYVPGVFNIGLGIVSNIMIDKGTSPESWTVDGLPMEVNVTLSIEELYSNLTMSKSGQVDLFMNNSSLLEFLANSAGVNLIEPQLYNKWHVFVNSFKSKFTDIPGNAKALVLDTIENSFAGFFTL